MSTSLRAESADRFPLGYPIWVAFAEAHPELGLAPSRFAFSRFANMHGERLAQLGVMKKVGRAYLVDRATFAEAAYRAIIGMPINLVGAMAHAETDTPN